MIVFSVIRSWISFAPFKDEGVAIGMEVPITLEHWRESKGVRNLV